jgi:hypothetical protein
MVSPKELAPNLYKQAQYKHHSVHQELQELNWIKNLTIIDSEDLVDEFFLLFHTLAERQLTEEKDGIAWKWTALGEYTVTAAYEVLFLGAFPKYHANSIWKARAEPHCRFFT